MYSMIWIADRAISLIVKIIVATMAMTVIGPLYIKPQGPMHGFPLAFSWPPCMQAPMGPFWGIVAYQVIVKCRGVVARRGVVAYWGIV